MCTFLLSFPSSTSQAANTLPSTNSLPHDFKALFDSLLSEDFFPTDSGATSEQKAALKTMVKRWESHIKEGKFKLSVDWDLKLGGEGGEMADCTYILFMIRKIESR